MVTDNKIIGRARTDVREMAPYSSARSIYTEQDGYIFLDANECSYEPYIGSKGNNRYAPQQPDEAIRALCCLYDISSRNLVLTRGADEAIDLLVRAFCESGRDSVLICPPTFPMYAHSAHLQGAAVISVPLQADKDFDLDIEDIKSATRPHTKIIFICSPNNPTGNAVSANRIAELCEFCRDQALVVVDETYIEFADGKSCIDLTGSYKNLVVLRTLSKAYAAAGLRAGVAIADAQVIELLRKILAPYPVARVVANEIVTILKPENIKRLRKKIKETVTLREQISAELMQISGIEKIYPSQANFLLVKVRDAEEFVRTCLAGRIIVRNQSHQAGLENCVRIAVGSGDDMARLLGVLKGKNFPAETNTRTAHIVRKTNETSIDVKVDLDCTGPVSIQTGIGFYDHMLEQIARHGGFSVRMECSGDLEIDQHHTVEDCAIALGQAVREALGDKRGIGRYGFTVPMDEALCEASLDLSGRFFLSFDGRFPDRTVGEFPCDMTEHVFRSLAENIGCTLHMKVRGENSHHMIEACFKSFGRVLAMAIRKQNGDILPSSKGIL